MTLATRKYRDGQLPGLLEDFFKGDLFATPFLDGSPFGTIVPDANILENGKNYIIELAAPGLDREDLVVAIDNGILTVSAKKEKESNEEGRNFRRREFSYNSFTRSFALPNNLMIEKIDAKYENGILRLILPKKQTSQAEPVKQIKVR